ncbi:siderophore-interacting protein [Nocardioides sp.]|uniref:siderophore-interacting protein n=1 Tax=Nocardioides sp. TaxID=35761 RepID=UPI003516C2BD
MSVRAAQVTATVSERHRLSPHLLRLTLTGPELADLGTTGLPDEWVGLIVPGQFQSRYYTVRRWEEGALLLDVVVHEQGLVADWATGDPVGDVVTLTEPKGSFLPPADAGWLLLVGDLTALPAMARIAETNAARGEAALPCRIVAEVPEPVSDYLPESAAEVAWHTASAEDAPDGQEAEAGSRLAEITAALDWPAGPGYFWMAGESAQMRTIRKHLMHERRLPTTHYDVMGYWRRVARRQPRAVDRRENP